MQCVEDDDPAECFGQVCLQTNTHVTQDPYNEACRIVIRALAGIIEIDIGCVCMRWLLLEIYRLWRRVTWRSLTRSFSNDISARATTMVVVLRLWLGLGS